MEFVPVLKRGFSFGQAGNGGSRSQVVEQSMRILSAFSAMPRFRTSWL